MAASLLFQCGRFTDVGPNPGQGTRELGIVYTPLHGVGDKLLRKALAESGFTAVSSVVEQQAPDGDFPTVRFPRSGATTRRSWRHCVPPTPTRCFSFSPVGWGSTFSSSIHRPG